MKNCYVEKKAEYKKITFRYAVGESIQKGREIHSYYELLYFINGNGKFLSESLQETLTGGMLFLIPKKSYHQFALYDSHDYTRLVIYFPDLPEAEPILQALKGNTKIMLELTPFTKILLNKMIEILNGSLSVSDSQVYLYGSFITLLSELKINFSKLTAPPFSPQNALIIKCVQYIEKNLTQPLSISSIAEAVHISSSTLFKCFKKHLGISVYKYITDKRILLGHELIHAGARPTEVYYKCGYNDYSSFYKAYLKVLGVSPGKETKTGSGRQTPESRDCT